MSEQLAQPIDFLATHHGSIITLCPVTDEARAWVDEYIMDDAPRFGRSIAIEPRYWAGIAAGIMDDNLRINT